MHVNAMKYLEIIPDFLSMYGVFTSQSTSQIRQEMSCTSLFYTYLSYHTITDCAGANNCIDLLYRVRSNVMLCPIAF